MAIASALVISLLISSVSKLLPYVKNSFLAPSSSSVQSHDPCAVECDLKKLIRTLKWIKATLFDAEEREIQDSSVKQWLKELKDLSHEAGYVIDEYMYEVYRAKVEARKPSELNPHKRKRVEGSVSAPIAHTFRVSDELVCYIKRIGSKFEEIAKAREEEAFRLCDDDGLRRVEDVGFQSRYGYTSYSDSNVFGREREKNEIIDLLLSSSNERDITVLPIVGEGGLGKSTLAKLVYDEERSKNNFDLFGWICVSENFNVQRIMQELIASFTQMTCTLKNLDTLHVKCEKIVMEKRVFVVLDDVWNEDDDLWELLCMAFKSAKRVVFIVTTCSDRVAKIMQTISPFKLGPLSKEDSRSLFKHYSGMNCGAHNDKLDLGEKIIEKYCGLPLALKSISRILCLGDEETWIEILENDLREVYPKNDIFGALQISYTHMPTYLRPCFLFCSLFPKDYEYEVGEMVELWIAQGYIECKGTKTLEEKAFEYIMELRERSFIEPIYKGGSSWTFKMHNLVHDLARLNSDNELYSIEGCKQSNPSDKVLHIYADDSNEPWDDLNLGNNTRLVTLILKLHYGSNNIDLSKAKGLRVLKLQYNNLEKNASLPNFVFPKLLRFLDLSYSIGGSRVITLPLSSLYHLERLNLNLSNSQVELELEALGNLINLQSLNISHCTTSRLPETIGNLVELQKLVIHGCEGLCFLPESLCELSNLKTLSLTECPEFTELPEKIGNLTNLQSLIIKRNGMHYLPPSFNKLCGLSQLDFQISLSLDSIYDQFTWFKDLDNLKGTVAIQLLRPMPTIEHACNFNLINKPHLEKLILSWGSVATGLCNNNNKHMLEMTIETNKGYKQKKGSAKELPIEDMDLQILEKLEPHPKLKHIEIWNYNGSNFPEWIKCPSSCVSLEELHLCYCLEITTLPFANLRSLKRLKLLSCNNMERISRDSLPAHLESLIISQCSSLRTVTGLEELELFVGLEIQHCERLASFPFELISEGRCQKASSLKKLEISCCPALQLTVNEVVPSVQCNIEIFDCMGLKEWCLQHKISYKPG